MNKICVLGSMNMDMVLNVKNLPKKGETLLVNNMEKIPGGKGANQAVAAQRLGSNVYMIAQIGEDDNGEILLDCLKKDGINTDYVFKDKFNPTGLAIITVDENADNMISVISGANMTINNEQIKEAEEIIKNCNIVISQFETPIETTIETFKIAKENGIITILNPAPATSVPDELLNVTDIIVPNETEALELTDVEVKDLESAKIAATKFIDKGVNYVIITLGEKGAALITKEQADLIPAYKVAAVDTTAAGDSFIGAVSSKLSKAPKVDYEVLKKAINFGNKVSSIAVTKKGAQISLPTLEEVVNKYGEE
ncbi:ribokinase [Oceanirhabdus sp. W0125-5]|uniref:ribokinase n=1 Tax=Oceanirhabdus sp. W0125-5 TaxID=2999116 RepID=UPI0022F2B046|nr:ribokinase [Oceanirhabdus sp. W0125-5]WBW99032.1 ribokinase [Oceanirhabdus sp. W0125-5]